jgi:ribonuclease HI
VIHLTSQSAAAGGEAFSDNQPAASDYLLVCHARSASICEGLWSFTLETAAGEPVFSAEDTDMGDLNRLTLLAAVRGLESIDGPASVMLLSNNRYMIRSLSESLPRWRENQFVWEHFGRRIDVQHADLWRRIDRALQIHRVQACLISTRLVSGGRGALPGSGSLSSGSLSSGAEAEAPMEEATGPWTRIDSPHSGVSPPISRRAPRDGLRRWLLSDAARSERAAPRNRFTAAELLESA